MEQINEKTKELLALISIKPTTSEIIVSLIAALALSLIIWFTYKKSNTKASYRSEFAVTLISLSLLSTILMDLIQSNLALSLGMLGSLSIVRFRTNIKDPRDIGFIFWSMATGLAASTGNYITGLVGSIVVSACIIASGKNTKLSSDMLLVVRGSCTDPEKISEIIESDCIRNQIQAKNIMSDSFELVYNICIHPESSNTLIKKLFTLNGIDTVNILAEAKNA